jgi:hypothetical protein
MYMEDSMAGMLPQVPGNLIQVVHRIFYCCVAQAKQPCGNIDKNGQRKSRLRLIAPNSVD